MNNITKRFSLFLFGCIPVRSLIIYIAMTINNIYLPYLGFVALIPVIGWIYILSTNSRETGNEVFGDKIWWNSLRPVHLGLYGLFAYNAMQQNPISWIYLFIDMMIGLFSFLTFHYNEGNFNELFLE